MQNDKTQANAFLVYTVLEDPESSRMSICRGRFTFTPYKMRLGEGLGLEADMEVWVPDISIRLPGLKGYYGNRVS